MNEAEMKRKFLMVATAELYNQRPNDPVFKKFSPKAMENVKLLAESLQKAKERGEIK